MSTAPIVKGQYSPKKDPHIPSYLFGRLQQILTAGANVTITSSSDNETLTIDATGGGGSGDVTLAGNNAFTGTNSFSIRPTFNGNTPWDTGNLTNPAKTDTDNYFSASQSMYSTSSATFNLKTHGLATADVGFTLITRAADQYEWLGSPTSKGWLFAARGDTHASGLTNNLFVAYFDGTNWFDVMRGTSTGQMTFGQRPAFAGNTPWDSGNLPSPAQTTQIREKLTADRTYYVRTDGNDINTGLSNTSGGAFLTITKALSVCTTIDFNGWSVIIQLGNGTRTETLAIPVTVGQGLVGNFILRGDTSTPSNVVLNAQYDWTPVITAGTGARIRVEGIKFAAGSTSWGMYLNANKGGSLEYQWCEFTGARYSDMSVQYGGFAQGMQTVTLSGSTYTHLLAEAGGTLLTTNQTIVFSGTVTYNDSFAVAQTNGMMRSDGMTFSGSYASAVGRRYNCITGGGITVGGAGTSYFPGSTAGNVSSPGWYT